VITPFGGQFDDNYNRVLMPAIEAAGFKPIRGDSVYGTRPVIDDIFHGIRSASVLVADVSGKNANVNYELGISHAFKRPVVIISQKIEDIPFDYQHLRFVIYDIEKETWAADLAENVTRTLKAHKEDMEQRLGNDGRKAALIGQWAGTLNQETDDGPVSIDTEMAMVPTTDGDIRGKWILHSAALAGYTIAFDVTCSTFSDQFIKLDFVSADKTIMTFGTFMARLSANARRLEGQYVGYGSVSDRIVNGAVILKKAAE
jgi:hypothetical protein